MLANGRYEIPRRGGDLGSVRGLTVDEVVNELMEAAMGGCMTSSLCGARVEARRMPEQTAKVHPKPARTEAHRRHNI